MQDWSRICSANSGGSYGPGGEVRPSKLFGARLRCLVSSHDALDCQDKMRPHLRPEEIESRLVRRLGEIFLGAFNCIYSIITATMLRPCLPRIGRALMTSRRSLHHMPALSHDFSKGVPEFLGPLAFELSWTRYQQLMLDELNKITVGTSRRMRDAAGTSILCSIGILASVSRRRA